MLRSGQPLNTQWNTVNRQGTQGSFHKGEIISARDAIENRRARILLGGGGMQLATPMEYNMTQAYPGQTWVHVSATNTAVTAGTTDPVSGLQVYSQPGWYCSAPGGVPIAGTTETPAYHIPQVPLPDASNVDDVSENFWVIYVPFGTAGADNCYTITEVNENTVTANDASGNSVTIYKPLELQGGLTGETIDSDAITYSSYTNNYNDRTATDSSSNTEPQYITPRYTVGQIITARMVNGASFTFPSGTFLLEFSPARQWSGLNTNATG